MTLTDTLSTRRHRAAGVRPDSPFLHVDWVLIACTVMLSATGLVLIRSTGANNLRLVERQSLFLVLGLAALVTMMTLDYRNLLDNAVFIYGGTVLSLVLVLLIGQEHKGAQGWFDIGPMQLQPAEFAKVGVIISLADNISTGAANRAYLRKTGERKFMVGVDLHAVMLANQQGGTIRGVAVPVRVGRRITVIRTQVWGDDDKLLAEVTTTHVPT